MVISENAELSFLNTFKVGGRARYFCVVKNLEELKDAVIFSKTKKLPFFVLGGGSNVLVSDSGFSGLVIKNEIKGIEEDGNKIIAGAGENWDSFVKFTVDKSLFGLENLSGIPGTVGASPVQNIGAYGVEVGDYISWVEVFDTETLKTKKIENKKCEFGYRESFFKKPTGKKFIITKVAFQLSKKMETNSSYKDINLYMKSSGKKSLDPKEIREIVLKIRASKMPSLSVFGTAGSFFKNPSISKEVFEKLQKKYPKIPSYENRNGFKKIPLAWVLDNICGLKGFKKGEVGLYERHSLILVNYGKSSASQISDFAEDITRKVKEKTDIDIEWEVQKI